MVLFQLPTKDYLIISSVLKDGPAARCTFTFKELLDTLEHIGFSLESKGRAIYDGKVLFIFKPGDKSRDAVSSARQDKLKKKLLSLFGWTKGTFGELPKV